MVQSGEVWENGPCFKFQASNNQVEYKALIAGFKLEQHVKATKVVILSYPKLLVSQINKEYEAKQSQWIEYISYVKNLVCFFFFGKFKST